MEIKSRVVKDKYPNLIFTTWETVDRPRQVIVSDMTAFTVAKVYYEKDNLGRRYFIFLLGLFICSFGVACTTKFEKCLFFGVGVVIQFGRK